MFNHKFRRGGTRSTVSTPLQKAIGWPERAHQRKCRYIELSHGDIFLSIEATTERGTLRLSREGNTAENKHMNMQSNLVNSNQPI